MAECRFMGVAQPLVGFLWVIGLFDLNKLTDKELDKHQEEMHYFYEGILWGVIA